jgi:3-oxoacyl-[acyl-carrier-protein] synthase II
MVPGEGGAVLVLEPLMAARARGARVYAEVLGYGLTCDAHHMTGSHPEGHGAARAMRQALDDAGLEPGAVDYISAHGTGTPTNDRMETLAAKAVFGDRARSVPMSSVKSMIGHTMGAASAIEAAVCSLAIHTGRVPPTIGLREPDPECDLDYVAGEARELPVAVAMNNAYAFGGNNSSVLFGRVEAGDGARS